jgi:hypothetical protein
MARSQRDTPLVYLCSNQNASAFNQKVMTQTFFFLSFFWIGHIACTQHHNNLSHKVCPKFKCHTLYKWTECKLHRASTFEHVQHIFNDSIPHWPITKTPLCVTPLLDALTFFNVKIVHPKAFIFWRVSIYLCIFEVLG